MYAQTLTVATKKRMQLVDITHLVNEQIRLAAIDDGTCYLFNTHTTAGLTINEGADPAVAEDIITGLGRMVPMDHPFKHREGNSPAHIMATLAGCSLTLLIENGAVVLGTWQKIFFCEFDGPRSRKVLLRLSAND